MSFFEDFEENKIGSVEHDCLQERKNKYMFQELSNKWITRDGIEIKLSDMNTQHLINSKKMIERVCIKEDWNPIDYPIYKHLIKEIEKR